MLNLPNILTLSRIAAIPLVVACFWLEHGWAQWLSMILFVAACVTDCFDGYFARRYHQISRFGRFLDPIADKLLVAAALVMLVDVGQLRGVHVLAALIILAREILVSGLREFLAELRVGVPVSQLAKWNNFSEQTRVQTGQSLVVWNKDAGKKLVLAHSGIRPTQSIKSYTVKPGDTLFSISKRFNVSMADLRKWNGSNVEKQIQPGKNITVQHEKN